MGAIIGRANMHFKWTNHFFAIGILSATLAFGAPFGTSFVYQGRLNDGTNPATGTYDLRQELFDADASGNSVAGPVTNLNVSISNGLFSTLLDFGSNAFR